MQKRPALQLVSPPAFAQRIKDEARAAERASLNEVLEEIPQHDLDRLKEQLTPLLSRASVFPEDRDTTTCLLQEWQMRGLSVSAFNAVYDLLWEDHREARQASSAPMRPRFEREYAPWFEPEPKPENRARLHAIPLNSEEAGKVLATYAEDCLNHALGWSAPDRPSAPTVTDRLTAFLRGTAPRR
jgi:hypothetical protein